MGFLDVGSCLIKGKRKPVHGPHNGESRGTIAVEYKYIDYQTCKEFNRSEVLTPNDTLSLIASSLQDQLDRAVTNSCSRAFLVAALFGLAALVPILFSRREVGV